MEKLINEKVVNVKYGIGEIIGIVGENKIIVGFDKLTEYKKFIYPDAFENFLSFENNLLQTEALEKIEVKKKKVKEEREEKIIEIVKKSKRKSKKWLNEFKKRGTGGNGRI